MKATITLVDGMQFSGTVASGHTVAMDADEHAGGRNAGSRPMELLLVGFGGCTGMDIISILRKKRQNVSGLEINVRGEQRETPELCQRVDRTVRTPIF